MMHDIEIKEIVVDGLQADAGEVMEEVFRRAIVERIANGLTESDAGTERDIVDPGSVSMAGHSKRDLVRSLARAFSSTVCLHHTGRTPAVGPERDQHQSSLASDHCSNAVNSAVTHTIELQYNPDTLSRSYQVHGASGDSGGECAQPFRLKKPTFESIKLEAEIALSDSLEYPDQNANAVAFGIALQLAALESLVNHSTVDLLALNALSQLGTLGGKEMSDSISAPQKPGEVLTMSCGGEMEFDPISHFSEERRELKSRLHGHD